MINFKYSVYFTDHLGVRKKINIDNIATLETGILGIENKRLYADFTFITNGIYYHPEIIGDLEERIEFIYKIDDNDEKSIKFVIDGVDYLPDNNIKVYCKTKGIKYSYKYSGVLNKTIKSSSVKSLLDKLIDIEKNTDNLMDIPFHFDYTIQDKSVEEVVQDLSKIIDFDYYYQDGIIYFENKKVIQKDDEAVYRFSELKHIIEFNTNNNKDDKKINKIIFNYKEEDPITAEPKIKLDIKNSPQCCSPDEVKIYTDDNDNTYKISPVNAFYVVYYTPLIRKPQINMEASSGEKIVVENFKLKNDEFVRVAGGIKELIAIDGVNNPNFEIGYNVITFDKVEKGEMKVTYKTDVLYGTIEHSKYPKVINFNIKHFNQILDYDHKIELNGYYPVPYDFTLNLISDWGIDPSEDINKNVNIAKKQDDVFVDIGSAISNSFGELEFNIEEYGVYKFSKDGVEDLYLNWFINKKELTLDSVKN
jgi:hypothetical protein